MSDGDYFERRSGEYRLSQDLVLLPFEGFFDDTNMPVIEPLKEIMTAHIKVPADWESAFILASGIDDTEEDQDIEEPLDTMDGEWYVLELPGWVDAIMVGDESVRDDVIYNMYMGRGVRLSSSRDFWLTMINFDELEFDLSYKEP